MVIPVGGLDVQQQGTEAPDAVKNHYSLVWWCLTAVLVGTTIGRLVASDVLGALITGIIAFWCYWMIRDRFENMQQCQLLMFGFFCLMQGIFELPPLLAALQGRGTRSQSPVSVDGSKMTYVTTIERHNFFDPSMGWHYNLQSAMLIVSAASFVLAALLSYKTYSEYPISLFEDDADQQAPLGGRFGSSYGRSPAGYGGAPSHPGGAGGDSGYAAGRPLNRQGGIVAFSGQGQRLGGSS